MPWNDYITLLLVSASAGLLVLSAYFYWGLNYPRPQVFAPALAGAGLILLVLGLHMVLTWPLGTHPTPPKPEAAAEARIVTSVTSMPASKVAMNEPKNAAFANICFGEPSVLFGAILLAAALSVARRWPMHGVALLGLVGGLVLIVIGVRIYNAGLTQAPAVTCAGFILTGLLGILALPTVASPTKVLRTFTAVLTLLAAVIWGGMGLFAYWAHVAGAAGIK
jgi:putative membrane protein